MTQALAALTAALCLCLVSSGVSQSTSCQVEDHCPDGFYCEPALLFCRKCLSCEDLHREFRPPPSACIKSVADCGPCQNGLVEDVNSECVPRSVGAESDGFPLYGWVLIALACFIILMIFCVIVWYVLKHPDTLKVLASTSTSMQSRCERGVPASAPELPPPYNSVYNAAPPFSPPPTTSSEALPNHHSDYQPSDDEPSSPFLKPPPERVWTARESAGRQAARIYNNPAYVRGAQPPSSYDNSEPPSPTNPDVMVQEEETMESTWTPSRKPADHNDNNANSPSTPGAENNNVAAAGSSLPTLLAAARATSLIRAPCAELSPHSSARQDPNNNGSHGESEASLEPGDSVFSPVHGGSMSAAVHGASASGHGGSSSVPVHGGNAVIINVVQTINAVQQRGDNH
ncbi:uncharacterized protein [Battus philenor]|uniref:uncharacterized protein isoform X2 n=1 Tax=Battus philenor TaxID=42288 RepID=UPI0035CF4696